MYIYILSGYIDTEKKRSVPQILGLDSICSGIVNKTIYPYWGPNNPYADKEKYKENNSIIVEKGTRVSIFFSENGYLFGEFSCKDKNGSHIGNIRMWLPENVIDIKN